MNYLETRSSDKNKNFVTSFEDPYEACKGAHAIAILTEWDAFKAYNWQTIYDGMQKPAFVFDGRNILNGAALKKIGFIYQGIGA